MITFQFCYFFHAINVNKTEVSETHYEELPAFQTPNDNSNFNETWTGKFPMLNSICAWTKISWFLQEHILNLKSVFQISKIHQKWSYMLKIVDYYFNGERKTLFYMETTLVNVVLNQFLMVNLFPFSYSVQIWKIKFFFKFGKNFTEVVIFFQISKQLSYGTLIFSKFKHFYIKFE